MSTGWNVPIEWDRAVDILASQQATPLLVDALRWQGTVLFRRGETSKAEELYERSRRAAVSLNYEPGHARALNSLGSIAHRRGELDQAERDYLDAAALAEQCGEARLVGMVRQNLGIIADIRGDLEAATAHYTESLAWFEATHDRQGMAWVLNNLGLLHAKVGNLDEAEACYVRALTLAKDRGDLMHEGIVEINRAELAILDEAWKRAVPCIDRALEIALQRGDGVQRAAALKLRGMFRRHSGDLAGSVADLRLALTLSAIGEDALVRAEILYELGSALTDTGDTTSAIEMWTVALEAFGRIGALKWADRVRERLTNGRPAPSL